MDLTKYYYAFLDFLHYCAHKLKEQPVIIISGKEEIVEEEEKREETIVYGMALLHLIGFFEWPLTKQLKPKNQRKIIME